MRQFLRRLAANLQFEIFMAFCIFVAVTAHLIVG